MTAHPRLWSAALAAAVVAFAPPALGAQSRDSTMPLPPGSVREKGLEARAGSGEGADPQFLQVYRSSAPVEMLLSWYQRRLAPTADAALDTADLQPGEVTPISHHITEHSFVDECADPEASPSASSDATPACKKWRRARDKKRALENSRVAVRPGVWIERFTLTWYHRGDSGELVRRQIEVRDAGLSKNWQHDGLRSQITLERVVVGQAGP